MMSLNIKPENPSSTPITSIPRDIAALPTPRIVALIPGQSPPDDKIPIFMIWVMKK
jgi:hypothetical protein